MMTQQPTTQELLEELEAQRSQTVQVAESIAVQPSAEWAGRLQARYNLHGKQQRRGFFRQALIVYRIYSEDLWYFLGYDSFSKWANEQADNTATRAYLQNQIVDLCLIRLGLSHRLLADIGVTKFTLLMPMIAAEYGKVEATERLVSAGRKTFADLDRARVECRDYVTGLLNGALTKSVRTIGAESGGGDDWEDLIDESMTVGNLRKLGTIANMIERLGLSDRSEDYMLTITIKGRAL